MRKIDLPFLSIMLIMLCSVLAGCSPSVENCNTPDITNLVAQAASAETAKQLGEEVAKTLSYEVKAVTITGTNEKDLFEIAVKAVVPAKINVISKEAMMEQVMETYEMLKELAERL